MEGVIVIGLSILTSIATLVLVSLGLAIIFGLMRIVNMAHGEFVMIGAFTTITLVIHLGTPLWLAVLVAPVVSAIIGVIVEKLLIRPLYGKRLIDTLLVTFGLSLVLFQIAVDIFGTTSPGIATPMGALSVGGFSVSIYSSIFLPVVTLVVIYVVYAIFTRTKYGLLARATAQNPEMANALGVVAARVNLITFALGCALAGLGGALIAPIVAVSPGMGQSYIAQAFLTVVTGGPAFLAGTVVASSLLGSVANLVSQIFTTLWGVTALMLTAMALIRLMPHGLSGSWRRQL
jgi:branched-chain amino acid transport system permease protein